MFRQIFLFLHLAFEYTVYIVENHKTQQGRGQNLWPNSTAVDRLQASSKVDSNL